MKINRIRVFRSSLIIMFSLALAVFVATQVNKAVNFRLSEKLDPLIDSISVIITHDDPQVIKVDFGISIRNPFSWNMVLDSFVVMVNHENETYLIGRINKQVKARPNEYIYQLIPTRAYLYALNQKVKGEEKDKFEIELILHPYFRFPLVGTYKIPFILTHQLNLNNPPKVNVDALHVNIQGEEKKVADISLRVTTNDFLPPGTTIQRVNYMASHKDKILLRGLRDHNLEFEGEENRLRLPARIFITDIMESVQSMQDMADSTIVNISGDLLLRHRSGNNTKVHLEAERMIKVPTPPEFVLERVRLEKLNYQEARMHLRLKIINHNPFGITVKNYAYNLMIEGREWTSDRIDVPVVVGGNSVTVLDFPIVISTANFGRATVRTLLGNTRLNYNFKGIFMIITPVDFIGSVNVMLENSGVIDTKSM